MRRKWLWMFIGVTAILVTALGGCGEGASPSEAAAESEAAESLETQHTENTETEAAEKDNMETGKTENTGTETTKDNTEGITVKSPVKAEIISQQMGNIFGRDDEIDLSLKTTNNSDKAVVMTWSGRVYDEDGRLIADSGEMTQNYGPNEKISIPMMIENPRKYGIYRVDVSCGARYADEDGRSYPSDVSGEFSVAIIHEKGEGNPRFGVNTSTFYGHWDTTEAAVQIMQMMGATVTRTQLIWGRIEPFKGNIHITDFITSRLKTLQDGGIDFVDVLTVGRGGSTPYTDDKTVIPETDEAIEAYARVAAEMAKTLWEEGQQWIELFNEFDLKTFNPTNVPPETYVKYLKAAYPAIKEACPEMQVLGLTTYNIQDNNREWLKRALDAGAYDYLDIVGVHPYDYNGGREGVFRDEEFRSKWDKTLELFSQYSHGEPLKPFWITEMGFSSYKDGHTQDSQAHASVLANAINQGFGYADRLIQYDLYDRSNEAERENNWGFVYAWNDTLGHTARGAKKSFLEISAYNEFFGKYAEYKDMLETDRAYAFRNHNSKLNKDIILLIAGHDAEKQVSYRLGCAEVELYDSYGNPVETLQSENGSYTFDITTEPLYIMGNFTTFEQQSSAE